MQPFTIDLPDSVLADLRNRLERTRWPDEIPGAGWDYGANLDYLKELTAYWIDGFDWRQQEQILNQYPQFTAEIDGLNIHFLPVKGKGKNSLPLILTHGWPSTFFELLKLVPLLTDPGAHAGKETDSFDVVIPSLPGYGFSSRPRERGFTSMNTARLWVRLMTEVLGYEKFAAHGGDVGAGVTSRMGLLHPGRLIGIHISSVVRPQLASSDAPWTEAEKAFIKLNEEWERSEDGYGHIQGTKPQTLAYGLNDSPAGLAAWIIEKYRSWSDCGGDIETRFSKDELLTNITIYWVTQTINSSMRHYYEQRHAPWPFPAGTRVRVPTGIYLTVEPVERAPREWAERTYDVRRYSVLPRGGHFAAMEEPELLAEDIRAFFRPLREYS